MRALAGGLAFLVFAAVPSTYRIDLKGGGAYFTNARPAERSGRYVFRTSAGTLMSIRKADVVQIRQAFAAVPPIDGNAAPSSPAAAARNQKIYAGRLHGTRATANPSLPAQDPYFRQSPYRPGVGEAYPANPNDYAVGKTFAYPPTGKVYEGLPPNKAPEGAPMNKVPEGPAVPADSAPPTQTPAPPPPPNR
jgi:hypothetical protein